MNVPLARSVQSATVVYTSYDPQLFAFSVYYHRRDELDTWHARAAAGMLFAPYRREWYWWEMTNALRRLVFTSAIVLLDGELLAQARADASSV